MSEYQVPLKEMMFVLREIAGLDAINRLPPFADATPELVEAVLGEAAQLAQDVVGPTNRIGDQEGTRVQDGRVVVPQAFIEAYRQFASGGWAGLALSAEHGGQGLPYVVGAAVEEMWQSANLAWSLCPLLTQGAARAVEEYAPPAVRDRFLRPMVTGEWTSTMNLTEPQAGSDLGALRTQAEPAGDHYRVTGQKIFITWGDHEMTANIVHLVLARLPGAPPGTKGLSLFIVPKFLVKDDGSLGPRNGVSVVSVEHKLGIHGSPTCVLSYENATGYLIGGENNGLACMFTMMNHARLGVGLEGVAVAERAYQLARKYARERVQGRAPGIAGRASIVHHPDVRRMLMTMKAQIEAMRSAAYAVGADFDYARAAADPAVRARHQARVELLTPVIKGWCTETGQVLASLALQVHGGMGYIEETGAAQHFRDARITTIYEGTTGIQAGDLVGRKIIRDRGAAMMALLTDIAATERELARPGCSLGTIRTALTSGREALAGALRWLEANVAGDQAAPGAISTPLLMLTGTVVGGWQMARAALRAEARLGAGDADAAFLHAKIATARFYAEQVMPAALAWQRMIENGCQSWMSMPEEQL